MAEATLLQHKKLLNLLELAKGNRNYLQMEKKKSHKFPSPLLTESFSYPKLHIFSFITQSILKFFPTPEPVARTIPLFQNHHYFIL